MSKKNRKRPSAEEIAMIKRRERMSVTGALDTVKSNLSRIDDPY